MTILLTGANGHLGAASARAAVAAGHEVRAFVRVGSDRRGLVGVAVDPVEGDLLDPESLVRAAVGVDQVWHVGAVYKNWAKDDADILGPAVTGTENVLRAAAAAGARRVVVVSSNAAVGYGEDLGRLLDETSWNTAPHAPYIRAKVEAERRAFALGTELGLEVVSVCPCGILGPWDYRQTPTTRMVRSMATGGPSVVDACLTDVRDVADGLVRAAASGRPGERYLLAGEPCRKERIAEVTSALTGRKVAAMTPPRALLWLLGLVGELRAGMGGPDPDVTRASLADVYGRHLLYDSAKARRELGWSYRPVEDVLRDSLRWLVHLGALPASGRVPAPDPAWA